MFDSLIHLQDSQTPLHTESKNRLFDSLIHLQDSQTVSPSPEKVVTFDSLIHLQDSQTEQGFENFMSGLIHLFTYKTLKR